LCVEVVQTMNDCYQHCLSTCQRLRDSLNMTQICPIDVASLSAAKLLYNYAIDAVCRLGMLLECWLFATNHVLVVWNQFLLHVHYLFSYGVKAFNDNEVANTTNGWFSMLRPGTQSLRPRPNSACILKRTGDHFLEHSASDVVWDRRS